jgi:hypothetical protein
MATSYALEPAFSATPDEQIREGFDRELREELYRAICAERDPKCYDANVWFHRIEG